MTGAQLAGGPSAALRELLSRDGRRAPPVLVGLLAVVLFAWWAANEGGVAPGAWYPGALLCLAALPWRTVEAAVFLAGFALATAAVGAWEVVHATAWSDP